MLLVHSKNLLLVGNIINYTEFLLTAYLSGISSSWPGHWQWQIQGRGPGGPTPPLFFDQNEAKEPKKIFPLIWRSGSATDWQVQNYLWWVVIIVMEWDERAMSLQVVRIYTTSVESQQYLQKDVLEALYGLSCFNHIFQSSFNRSVVWPLISNHFVKGVLVLCQTV